MTYRIDHTAEDAYIVSSDGEFVAVFDKIDDAVLFTTAPDLLAALEFVIADNNSQLDYEAAEIIRAAIAKAKGE